MRILDVSKTDINTKTDIAFDYEEIKEARKVVAIRFVVRENATDTALALVEVGILARLTKHHGLPLKEAEKAVERLGEEPVWEILRTVEGEAKAGKLRKSSLAFLRHLLKTSTGQPNLFEQELAQERQQKEERKARVKAESEERERQLAAIHAQEHEKREREIRRILEQYHALPEEEQRILEAEFLEAHGGSLAARRYKAKGLGDILAKNSFVTFLGEKIL